MASQAGPYNLNLKACIVEGGFKMIADRDRNAQDSELHFQIFRDREVLTTEFQEGGGQFESRSARVSVLRYASTSSSAIATLACSPPEQDIVIVPESCSQDKLRNR